MLTGSGVSGNFADAQISIFSAFTDQDNSDDQILFNGRVWRNLYLNVSGDQFLFSDDFHPGTITVSGKLFAGREVRYDIYNDEILVKNNRGIILQLNKEMVSSFTIDFQGKTYDFVRMIKDSVNSVQGYVNILYRDKLWLFVRYKKEIIKMAEHNKSDAFSQTHRLYIKKNEDIYPVYSKYVIYRLFPEQKKSIRVFIRRNKLNVTVKDPESLIPVIDFCNKY